MKTIPPPCPEPESGVTYWRSLDQLADAPEFRQWVEREFPAGASEFADPVSRRHFVKIMSASFMLAGLGIAGTGCRRPEEKILPFSKMPEGYVHGVAQHYATAMPTRVGAIPLVVKSHEARPVKIEGNDQLPSTGGATNIFAQASILNLYDVDRAQRFALGGHTKSPSEALDALKALSRKFAANGGQGLAFLMEDNTSPSRARMLTAISAKFPNAKSHVYEPVSFSVQRQAASLAFGKAVTPFYKLDQANVIVSLDCDFIGGEEDNTRYIRDFAKGRKLANKDSAMNRLYAVEGLMTLTGVNADHRLRVPTSQVLGAAARLAAEVIKQSGNAAAAPLAPALEKIAVPASKWFEECAKDLLLPANRGKAVVLAGQRQSLAVHLIAQALNSVLGGVGSTVVLVDAPIPANQSGIGGLAQALNGGSVDTLVVLGGNPAYNAPADLDWINAQKKAKTVVRLGYYEDETFAALGAADWHLPAAHYLESWGDARMTDGTLVPVQPLIAPLFGGLTELEVLAHLGGIEPTNPHETVRETFRAIANPPDFENAWRKFLHDGFLAGSAAKPVAGALNFSVVAAALPTAASATLTKDALEIVFHRDASLDDGRYNNNGWLQEMPDPITKMVWDNAALLSRKTAADLAVKAGDEVEIALGNRKVTAPVWIQPGFADNSLGLALGYGRTKTGRVGKNTGFNAYALRGTTDSFAVGAKITKTGKTHKLVVTQEHGSMEGRPIIREANLAGYKKKNDFARNSDLEAPGHSAHIAKDKNGNPEMIYKNPYVKYDDEKKANGGEQPAGPMLHSDVHQWGMSIDLTTCVGCATCVVACQSENNIPIVGKEQVSRNREMHWMRIDRYYSGASEKGHNQLVDDPQIVTQPMLCQHCENAPCESVCPVNATVHDEEGLNVMAYNRCVGTRYCSNNCPYKVRRFNFFDYNKRTLEQLSHAPYYKTPLTGSTDGEWDMIRWLKSPEKGYRPEDEWELLKLVKNPDVSVRMRGIMEKCTFCIQRIESAKISQKLKARDSGDVQVPEGAFKTACQQACPAEAIVFGNLLDPKSRVSEAKKNDRDYSVLGFLDTRPRLTYLARIRNPNPAMPDALENPLNLQEYMDMQHANPFEEHGAAHAEAAGHVAPKGAH